MIDFLNTRFANPTVDFAFKRIFGTEQYKKATDKHLSVAFFSLADSKITARQECCRSPAEDRPEGHPAPH